MPCHLRLSHLLTLVLLLYSFSLLAKVEFDDLTEAVSVRLERVQEFVEIKKIAHDLGVKEVYLFGGTAAAWAHYVYADLEREEGSKNYLKEHFDYDYTSIFRSNQDMDIAIDGTPAQAAEIEKIMAEKFPFFQGKKSVFEVRLLRTSRGDKDAIIGNPDFLNQNNDSHSTGLIEIAGDGKKAVLDVKDMNSEAPKFLKDVYAKKLHFYFDHELHITTKRFKEGKNPEILAVIRYLTKVFQYELEIDSESRKAISRIITDFNPADIAKNDPYVAGWIERNGTKLFQNAVNVEYAWNALEELKLRKKLISLKMNVSEQYSLSWWMNKEPLRSKPLGMGSGKTARELNISIVAHETNSFEAFESILKAHSGDPNVFVSRENAANEFAALGEGFYVRVGKKGAKDTGLTIRFYLNPEAREGEDFLVNKDFVLIKNKNALQVIPESLQISPIDYFRKLSKGELIFDASDKGVQEKVRRKILTKIGRLTSADQDELRRLLKEKVPGSFIWEVFRLYPSMIDYSEESFIDFFNNHDLLSRATVSAAGDIEKILTKFFPTKNSMSSFVNLLDRLDVSKLADNNNLNSLIVHGLNIKSLSISDYLENFWQGRLPLAAQKQKILSSLNPKMSHRLTDYRFTALTYANRRAAIRDLAKQMDQREREQLLDMITSKVKHDLFLPYPDFIGVNLRHRQIDGESIQPKEINTGAIMEWSLLLGDKDQTRIEQFVTGIKDQELLRGLVSQLELRPDIQLSIKTMDHFFKFNEGCWPITQDFFPRYDAIKSLIQDGSFESRVNLMRFVFKNEKSAAYKDLFALNFLKLAKTTGGKHKWAIQTAVGTLLLPHWTQDLPLMESILRSIRSEDYGYLVTQLEKSHPEVLKKVQEIDFSLPKKKGSCLGSFFSFLKK